MTFHKELYDILPLVDGPLSILEAAKAGCLPPALHIDVISQLMYPDQKKIQDAFKILLKTAIMDKSINVLTVNDFSQIMVQYEQSRSPNKYKDPPPPGQLPALSSIGVMYASSDLLPDSGDVNPKDRRMFVIHRDEIEAWLKNQNKWPLDEDYLLSSWWPRSSRAKDKPSNDTINTQDNIFRREGQMWTLCYDGLTSHFKESKGLLYISYLIGSPLQEYHASELVKVAANQQQKILNISSGEISTQETIANYRNRLRVLTVEIEEAEQTGNPLLMKELLAEKEALVKEIKRAVGIYGKLKEFSDDQQKNANAVSTAISRAIKKMVKEHPSLHKHLSNAIRRGKFFSYVPETDISWITIR